MKKLMIAVALVAIPATAFAGLMDKAKGIKDSATCNDDKGVEQAGKDMDEKAYNALIATETSLGAVADAAGKKDIADKAHDNLKKWQVKDKAPSGVDRVKQIDTSSGSIQKGAEAAGGMKLDDKGKASLAEARNQLRKAVVYVAWAAKIGEPVPANAKAAIDANKACAAKVKAPGEAAAALGNALANLKKTYSAVSEAAKKAGAADLSDAEKAKQDSEVGAPAGLAGV